MAARERMKFRTWLAGKRDPEVFGEQQAAVQVNLNIGQLHLNALRNRGSVALAQQRRRELQGAGRGR